MHPRWLLAALVAAVNGLISAHAIAGSGRAGLQSQCWSPEALSGTAGEKKIVRGDHRFDTPPDATGYAPPSPVPQPLRGAIRRVTLPPGKKLIALTFDLCETKGEITGYDAALVDTLRANGAKATFFTGGKWMRSHPERIRQLMSDPLFEIGNHGEAHNNLRLISGAALATEITGPQVAYAQARSGLAQAQCVAGQDAALEAIPSQMRLFRFPFGACNASALQAVNDAGLLAIQWDLSTGDPVQAQSATAISDAMLRARPGAIIIGHANGRGFHTAEALAMALPALKAKGFEFVTVSELLAQGTPEITATCYNARPGDTDKYDAFFKPRPQKTTAPAEAPHVSTPAAH